MRLYIDPNYTPPVIKLIKTLHGLEYPETYEVVTGSWQADFSTTNTVVFLVDTNKQGLNTLTLDHYADGFKVVAYKKPEGRPFDPFNCGLTLMSQWKKLLTDINNTSGRMLISISNTERSYRKHQL